jgi:RNA polymerase sigma factor (sigma-70 family)
MKGAMASSSSVEQRRFEAMYEAHGPEVLAYCARRVAGPDAADACAETFLVAWRRIDDVPPPPATLPYLYGVAGRVIANHRRSFRRRSKLAVKLRALGVAPPADPAVVSLQLVTERDVVAAVRELPPVDREIVMLWAWEDLPRSTIAEIVGMSTAAVDQRIHRAYRRLGRALRPTLADAADDRCAHAQKEAT